MKQPSYPGDPDYAAYLADMPDKYKLITFIQDMDDRRTTRNYLRENFHDVEESFQQSQRTIERYRAEQAVELAAATEDET